MKPDGNCNGEASGTGVFHPTDVPIAVAPLLRLMGYRDTLRVRADIVAAAESAAERARELIAPEVRFRRLTVETCGGGVVTLKNGGVFHSQSLSEVVSGCGEIIVFLLTLGPDLDREAERLAAGEDLVISLFMEMAGWIAIEGATRQTAQHLKSLIGPEYRLKRRMGPGYGDWPLEQQRPLFDQFDPADLPVTLLESCAMLPRKSRSGLYGIAPAATTQTN